MIIKQPTFATTIAHSFSSGPPPIGAIIKRKAIVSIGRPPDYWLTAKNLSLFIGSGKTNHPYIVTFLFTWLAVFYHILEQWHPTVVLSAITCR